MVIESKSKLKVGPELKKASRINLRDLTNDFRLEASAYGLKCIKAQEELRATGFSLRPVYGNNGLAVESHNAFQFARNFVRPEFGVPFMGSADIIFVDFRPRKFLSRKNTKRLDHLMVKAWDVLLSCSGTIGNVALAPPDWTTNAASQDVLRIRFDDPTMAGFITAFLRSPWGRAQTVGSSYGSVISHIEPQHLERVLVPLLPAETIKTVGEAFCRAAQERSEANRLLREAEGLFATVLGLPSLPGDDGQRSNTVRLSELDGRFDGTYHSRRPRTALTTLKEVGAELTTVKEYAGEGSVRAVTKFRERTFAKQGLPFVSSKEVLQIDPINLDRLAVNAHRDDMPEIGLEPGMVLVSRSGTVGRIMLVPNYMKGWAATEHLLRVVCSSRGKSAYLYAWLNSKYGQALLLRYRYGSVIVSLDRFMLESMPVPVLREQDQEKIATLSLKANELRESAWHLEQEALALLSKSIRAV